MPINFPDSPTNGQIFTSGSTSWIYDGVKWGLNTNVAVSNDSMPVGSILWYANTSTAPPGWIAADGSAVSRTTYATLFGIIGTTYGSGDGSTTFNVPSVAATTGKYYIRYTTSLGTVTTTSLATAPVGTMLDWPTTSSYPTGYLRADGSAVSRTSYADLFSLIGTTYGSGDGSTTFNLPNMVQAGTGSPVTIIKASLGGTVEPSTVAHASSHIRGGSDIIDGDRVQVDYTPTYYTRDSSDVNAGANTDLTAHLKGIDNRIRMPRVANITVPRGTSVQTQTTSTTPIYWSNLGSLTVPAIANDILILTTWLWWDGFDYFANMYPCTLDASNNAINYLTTATSVQVADAALYTVQYTHKQSTISYKVKAGDIISGNVKVGYYHNRNSGAGAYQLLGASGQTAATVVTLTNLGQ